MRVCIAALVFLSAVSNLVAAISLKGAVVDPKIKTWDDKVAACVFDSPFASLPMVAKEVVQKNFKVPKMLVGAGLQIIRNEVRAKAQFDLLELQPVKSAREATCPALFGVASDDAFVLPHHTRLVYEAWQGEKSLFNFTGGHNGARPDWFKEEGAAFIARELFARAGLEVPPLPSSSSKVPRAPPPVASAKKAACSSDDEPPRGQAGQLAKVRSPEVNALTLASCLPWCGKPCRSKEKGRHVDPLQPTALLVL